MPVDDSATALANEKVIEVCRFATDAACVFQQTKLHIEAEFPTEVISEIGAVNAELGDARNEADQVHGAFDLQVEHSGLVGGGECFEERGAIAFVSQGRQVELRRFAGNQVACLGRVHL